MKRNRLQIDQLERKMKAFAGARDTSVPSIGWLRTVRTSLGMTLQQMGDKLNMTKQSAREIEMREMDYSITLKSLRDAANALEMELVYGLVPKDGSLDELIERKAKKLAAEIVLRTSNSMRLEDQGISEQRIKAAIEERTMRIKNELPKSLWD
ncbi:MAG: mobile mystery protein A [Flavobacteriales bacterium]|nr:mobile mystery protein A [Flavobacteriales bacterium]